MKYEFISRQGNDRLILLYGGWSTDASFYSSIEMDGWDTLAVWGYDNFDFPSHLLEGYTTIALFAWSFGVYAATKAIDGEKISLAVAVNGTPYPIDDKKGIPVNIFKATADSLSAPALRKFIRRISGKHHDEIKDKFDTADIDRLLEELRFIEKEATRPTKKALRWQRAYISENDLIFPATNQISGWQEYDAYAERCILPEESHYTNLSRIIRTTLPHIGSVGKRFASAFTTYENEASAQRSIVEHLVDMAPSRKMKRMIEIGPGTGLLSRHITEKFMPEEIDFIELYPLTPFNIAPTERYHTIDAEKWFAEESAHSPGSADAIISANTIQWFLNPRAFFRHASKILRKDGMLLCSTFLPGNLEELKRVNPYSLIYRSENEIRAYLNEYFEDVRMEQEDIIMDFDSPRMLLAHLSHTGVGGNFSSRLPLSDVISRLPSRLTYRPLYILCKNPRN